MFHIFVIVIIVFLLYYAGTKNFSYWKNKGIKYVEPMPFFGNTLQHFLRRKGLTDIFTDFYNDFPDERFVGLYQASKKILILRDLELIKRIMTVDFEYFYRRGMNPHKEVTEPMWKNLFCVDGDVWKLCRLRMTPAFTSAKLKAMFPLIVDRTLKLQKTAEDYAKLNEEINIRELMARYTTDFIATCGFGLDPDTLNDANNIFRRLGKRIFTITKRDALIFLLKVLAPETFRRLHFFAPEIESDCVTLVSSVIKERNHKPSGRNDFIDLLLEQQGKMTGESIEYVSESGIRKHVEIELDESLMAAQVLVFFAAGFETSSTSTSYAMHQLSFHPEEQRKCQEEIDEVLNKYDNKLCYDAVKEMKYLEKVFQEALRMFPPLGILTRECSKPYRIPGTDVMIDEGVIICIPVQGIQNDVKYFDHPDKFDPERFNSNNENIKNPPLLPFGLGPRACIGERMGLMQSLAGIAALLSKFTVVPTKNSVRYPKTDPATLVVQSFTGGLPVKLVPRGKTD